MISGAANDSEPHRVCSRGSSGEMKRDKPKSVSLSKGRGGFGRRCNGIELELVDGRVNG